MLEIALAAVVVAYGVVGALAAVLQLVHMRGVVRPTTCRSPTSALPAAGTSSGSLYGLVSHSLPLVVVDSLGAAAMVATIRGGASGSVEAPQRRRR